MQTWPEIEYGLQLYRRAWRDLHSSRPIGMAGPGRIPWTAVNEWAKRHGVEGEQFDMLVECVEAQDEAYLAYIQEQKPDKKDSGDSETVRF